MSMCLLMIRFLVGVTEKFGESHLGYHTLQGWLRSPLGFLVSLIKNTLKNGLRRKLKNFFFIRI